MKKGLNLFVLLSVLILSNINSAFALESKYETNTPVELETSAGIETIINDKNWGVCGETDEECLTFDSKKWVYNAYLTYVIPEDYSEDTIVIRPEVVELLGFYQDVYPQSKALPSDTFVVSVRIINNSKYEYNYDEASFIVYPGTTDEQLTYEYTKLSDGEDAVAFNGEVMTDMSVIYRTHNESIKALISRQSNATEENLDAALKAIVDSEGNKIYPNGTGDLDKYYIDFYSKKFGYSEPVSKLEDFTNEELGQIFGRGNKMYRETNVTLTTVAFNFLYNNLLGVVVGDQENKLDSTDHIGTTEYSVGSYMRDETKGDKEILESEIAVLEKGSTNEIDFGLYFNGPDMGNAYQNYTMIMHTQMTYTASKGKVIAHYVDENGKTLSDDVITTGKVGEGYTTNAKDLLEMGYELIRIENEENKDGEYTKEDIEVTYVYQFVMGQGDNEQITDTIEKPKTGLASSLLAVNMGISAGALAISSTLKRRK